MSGSEVVPFEGNEAWPIKRNFLEKAGVLMVRKDMVGGWKGSIYPGHVGARQRRTEKEYLE